LVCDPAIYLLLINNFKNLGSFKDADNCYYKYRNLEQKDKKWYSSSNKYIDSLVKIKEELVSYPRLLYADLHWLFSAYLSWIYRFNWSKLYDLISEISCGYGVRVLPILLWMIGLSLIFAFGYHIFDGIAPTVISETTTKAANPADVSIFDSLYFSITALIGKPTTSFNPIGRWKYIVMIESILGYLLLALFVVVIIRKIIR